MNENYVVFLDESGNAGANLLDSQPIFVFAGISVTESNLAEIEAKFDQLKLSYGFKLSDEIKGRDLIRSNNHQFLRESVELILADGLPIFGEIIERRFMICCLIVETFFDPVYNDRVDVKWTHPIPLKINMANHLYDNLSESTITFAARTLIYTERKELEELLDRIKTEMKDKRIVDGINIIKKIEGARTHLDELADVLKHIHNIKDPTMHMTKGTLKAPNITSFFDILMRIEHLYQGHPDASIKIIFDSSSQFDRPFREVYYTLKSSEPAKIIIPERIPLTFGFQRINSFKVGNSSEMQLLQCADFFATGLRYIHNLCMNEINADMMNNTILFFIALCLYMADSGMANIVASKQLNSRFWEMAKKYAPS
ncbi:MAG: DUF3800 domain-containing protein [Anaerolineaceae bacterium]|nr:DUF3800 domain-containing protein [Anaerolineaceae bacterium]